ncbi:MAG: hypothetical protein GY906_02145 [bacterium]|nr:hypothetical protein [bacterium]
MGIRDGHRLRHRNHNRYRNSGAHDSMAIGIGIAMAIGGPASVGCCLLRKRSLSQALGAAIIILIVIV